MKKILMGFMLGVFLTVGLYFFKGRNTLLHLNTGFLLDQDALYMEDGSIIYGRVLQEDGGTILVEAEKGYFTLDRKKCKSIQKDFLLRYIRELM